MVFRSIEYKQNFLWYKVNHETIADYRKWILTLINAGVTIQWIVCDGKRWLLWWFGSIPTQMCLFHQKQIVLRYITKRSKLVASKELLEVVSMLWKIRSETWIFWLNDWYRRYEKWLKERNENWWFKHRKVRSAYRSLETNLPFLFLYEKYNFLPKTTNSLEWKFSWLKQRLWNHRWLRFERKQKFINWFLNG